MKKFTITLFWIMFIVSATAGAQSANDTTIKITEIGAKEPADTEWVKIQNQSKSAVNITGWKFFENGTNHKLNSFRGDFTLDPNENAIIANKADLFLKKYSSYSGAIFDSSWSNLNEDGEEIGLRDEKGKTIELFKYSVAQVKSVFDTGMISAPTTQTSTPAASNGTILPQKTADSLATENKQTPMPPTQVFPQTILPMQSQNSLFNLRGYFVFVPEDFALVDSTSNKTAAKSAKVVKAPETTTSKAKNNEYENGDLSNSLKITEIYPNPVAGENEEEWIEIFNSGKEAVNLGNWTLSNIRKKSSPFVVSDAISLESGEYMVFKKSETKITLNNEKDEVFLGDFNGNIIDSVPYEKSKKSFSYALIQFGGEAEWEWVDEPTPNAKNQTFEKIAGEISLAPEENPTGDYSFAVKTADNESKKITFARETLDFNVAQAVLKEGSTVVVQAKKGPGDEYILRKIDNVSPPTENPSTKKSLIPWIFGSIVTIIVILNIRRIVRVLKKLVSKIN